MEAAAAQGHAAHASRERGGHAGRPQEGPPPEPVRWPGDRALGRRGSGALSVGCPCIEGITVVYPSTFFFIYIKSVEHLRSLCGVRTSILGGGGVVNAALASLQDLSV